MNQTESVRADDDIVRAVQPLALVLVGDERQATVVLSADHAAATVLARDEPALTVDGVAVGVVRGMTEDADRAIALVEAHHPVVGDVREDEMPASREVGRPFRPAPAGPQTVNARRAVEAGAEPRIQNLVVARSHVGNSVRLRSCTVAR